MSIQKAVSRLFGKRALLATNTVCSGLMMGFGDWIVQQTVTKSSSREKTDWPRTGRMFAVGLCFGPVSHTWYTFLDYYIPPVNKSITTVLKKVALDQAVAGPLFLVYFFIANGLLEGKTFRDCCQELRQKFMSVYVIECLTWPTAQVFNFYFLPPHFRVIYIGGVAVIYDAFLSFVKYEPSSEWILIFKPKD